MLQKKIFVPAFFKVSIDHLFDILESGKRNYCFVKSLGKALNFRSKTLYEPCHTEITNNFVLL